MHVKPQTCLWLFTGFLVNYWIVFIAMKPHSRRTFEYQIPLFIWALLQMFWRYRKGWFYHHATCYALTHSVTHIRTLTKTSALWNSCPFEHLNITWTRILQSFELSERPSKLSWSQTRAQQHNFVNSGTTQKPMQFSNGQEFHIKWTGFPQYWRFSTIPQRINLILYFKWKCEQWGETINVMMKKNARNL